MLGGDVNPAGDMQCSEGNGHLYGAKQAGALPSLVEVRVRLALQLLLPRWISLPSTNELLLLQSGAVGAATPIDGGWDPQQGTAAAERRRHQRHR